MTAITFDTLAYSQTLQKAGVAREQADAMAQANAEALKEMVKTQQLATKQDLSETKHEILKWLIGLIIAQTTLTITAFAIGISLLK